MAQLKDLLVNGSARVIGSLFANLSGNVLNFGVCSTAAATAAKTVTTNGTFELITGSKILVLFSETDSSNAPTLNVNGTGAKSIKINASDGIGKGFLVAQQYYWFVYDGTNWRTAGAGITQIIPTQYGGTGNSSFTANRVIYSNTATKLASGSITTDGAYLGNVNYLSINAAHQTNYKLYVNGNTLITGGLLKITNNNNTLTIGSQNTSFTHIYNSANIAFILNNSLLTTTGNLGSETYPWNNLYIGKTGTKNIYYVGSKATNSMIRFLDNTSDAYGNGISIGGGGAVVIGAGESATNMSVSAGTETLYLLSDGAINVEAHGDTIANRIGFQVDTSGNIIPVKAETGNNNVQNIGSSSYKWANIYATTFQGNATSASTATMLSSNAGNAEQPIYFSGGKPVATSYALKATVNSGTANRIAYYTANNIISSGSITTDGGYLGAVSYLSVNTAHQTNYRAYINGTSYFNNNATFNGHVLPNTTNSHNLGSSSNQWGSVYARKLSTSLTGGTRTTAGGDKGSSANPRYFPEIWTFNAGITPANGDIITIETPGPGHDYGVFLSTNNGTNYYPIVLSGTGRLTTHYGTGTFLTLIFDSDQSAASMFALAGQNNTTRVTVSGGCWRVINYYDSGNPGDWNLRQYNIKAAAAIRAGHIIGGTDAGYKEIDSGAAFDVRYAVLYASSNISSGSAGSGNYIHHYAVNIKNSSNNNVSGWTSYKNLYIKGTLNGTIFTPISGGSPFVQDLTAADDGYSYFYIGRAYGGNAMTFDTTGSKIYDYRNSAPQFHSGNVVQDFTGANSGNAANINADTFAGMTRQQWLNTVYPIGSIYMSVSATSPATLFGGTWESLGGRFLIGQDGTYTAGSTGGEASHTHSVTAAGTNAGTAITKAQLPNYVLGDIPGVVPYGHANWNNNHVTGNDLGAASSSKPGVEKVSGNSITSGTQYSYRVSSGGSGSAHTHTFTGSAVTSGSASTLPPYLAVYMWKRTA